MTFKQGVSGNLHGNRHRTRHLLNQEFMQALLLNFRHQGKKAIEKVARNQPAVYLKILALLVPRELKIEQNQSVKAMTDEQLEAGIEAIRGCLRPALATKPRSSRLCPSRRRSRRHPVRLSASVERRPRLPPCFSTSNSSLANRPIVESLGARSFAAYSACGGGSGRRSRAGYAPIRAERYR
jgi:hypothetical protein